MAKRPFFIPSQDKEELVTTNSVEFTWFSGFAKSQKQKSISSFHENISKEFKLDKILEISTKSENKLGIQLSAFNLIINYKNKEYFLESLFQGSKIFTDQGPNEDIYEMSSIDAKKDERIKRSDLKEFSFFGETFSLDFDFYSWLYFIALNQNNNLKAEILNYEAFTDIEFNPEKSLNCQAYSAALYSSMVHNKILNNNKEYKLEELKNLIPSKKFKNYQQKLI
ncbi:DarT1-associated NADAR antitoxin family protein [Candidatus Pelagibacter sp. HIMB1587]|uniref:DarT1-associated NADAR antitoxin family protein n=1 Tax=Candidatus Pelagibacter sp. HIMB1587 TaxID=3413354 RepID=UPI003F86E8B0